LKAHDSKSCKRGNSFRGFESLSLRQPRLPAFAGCFVCMGIRTGLPGANPGPFSHKIPGRYFVMALADLILICWPGESLSLRQTRLPAFAGCFVCMGIRTSGLWYKGRTRPWLFSCAEKFAWQKYISFAAKVESLSRDLSESTAKSKAFQQVTRTSLSRGSREPTPKGKGRRTVASLTLLKPIQVKL
jgi:hypothetical protein